MITMSAGGPGPHGSTGPVSEAGIVRAIMEGQGPKASLGFNPPEASVGKSVGTPALDEVHAGRFGG